MSKGVLLDHDSTRPHMAAAALTPFGDWDFRSYVIPPYNPDLDATDYFVFEPLKDALR